MQTSTALKPRLSRASAMANALRPGQWPALLRVQPNAALALVDQAIVSGSRFVTTVVIGRVGGAEQLGAFALALQVLVIIAILQESLISAPYTIFCNRYKGAEQARFAGHVFLHAGLQTTAIMLLLAVVSLGAMLSSSGSMLAEIGWILTAITPFILLREFGRRFVFAHLRMHVAVILDSIMAAIQIGGLIALTLADSLTVTSALWVTGLSAAVPGIGWLVYDRKRFRFRLPGLASSWRQNWRSGRWLFGSQAVAFATDASLYWLLALVSGLATTGVFAACMAIVQLTNPLLLGITNWLEPSTTKAYADGGFARLARIVRKSQFLLFVMLAAFSCLALLAGPDLIALLYGGEYAAERQVIFVLALSVLASAVGLPPHLGLRAIEKASHTFLSNVLESVVIVAFVVIVWTLGAFELVSAAYALLIGGIATAFLQSAMFFRSTNRSLSPGAPNITTTGRDAP